MLQPPNAPKNVVIKEITSRSISISWSNDNSQPISGYSVQFKEKISVWNEIDWKLVNGDFHSIQINHLQPANEYNLRIFAKNLMGESTSSEVISFKTDAEIPSAPPQALILKAASSKELILTWSPAAKEFWNGEILVLYFIVIMTAHAPTNTCLVNSLGLLYWI